MIRNTGTFALAAGLLLVAILCAAGCTTAPAGNNTTATPASTLVTAAPTATAVANLSNLTIRDELAARAASYAARVSGDNLTLAVARGPNSTEFGAVQQQLQAIRAGDPQAAYVYTVEQTDGISRFMVDSEYGQPNGSSPGDLLTYTPTGLPRNVTAPGATGVYTDEWGTFVSGYAPVRNSTGAMVGLLLVDVRFEDLKRMIAGEAVTLAAQVDAGELATAIAKGENSTEYRAIADQLKAIMARDGRLEYINIFEQANGTARFVADSEYGTPDASHLGETGIELPSEMPSVVTGAGATNVYTDRWGTNFTGYAPIRDATGRVVAVFRIDMDL